VCRLPLATVTIKPGQRSTANETTDQRWRWWDDATEKSNRRDDTRAGVTNLFTVEAETAAVELTKCRLYTEEGLTGTTLYTLPSECPDPDQDGAVNEGVCGLPATAPIIERERRREASDGNDAVRDIEKRNAPDEFEWQSQHGMSLHRSDNTNQRTKNEGPTTTTIGDW